MKSTLYTVLTFLTFLSVSIISTTDPANSNKPADENDSGYIFDVDVTKINSEYSEIPSAVFRNKLVLVS